MNPSLSKDDQNKDKKRTATERAVSDELIALKEENQELLNQYEDVVARTNTLTVEAEVARLEFDQIFNAVGDPFWVIDEEKTIILSDIDFF
jgi:PAS domain-containing protein